MRIGARWRVSQVHRYSDSDIGQGRDPDPANKGKYLSRGIAWNTLRSGDEQYAGWEHWSTVTSDSTIDTGLAAVPDRPMMSEDRFRRRDNAWRQKDMHSDDEILKEIPGIASPYSVDSVMADLVQSGRIESVNS